MRPCLRILLSLVTLALVVPACEQGLPDAEVTGDAPPPEMSAPPSRVWRTVDDSRLRVLHKESDHADLAVAVARARQTVDDARTLWQAQQRDGGTMQHAWAIQWRAPTSDGGAEYVWVEPMTWSAFRIEGRLASPPQHELACGKRRDELVGFPAEELVDWVRYENADFTGAHEGGFTIAALDD